MEVLHRDGLARIARVKTRHGYIDTPAVMPVINPNIITVPLKEIEKIGFSAIITNSYIIRRTEKLRTIAQEKGIHSLLNFSGPIMTDSGTFQEYVYGGVEFGNEEMVGFQESIGSDIVTIRDIFTNPDDSYETVSSAVNETYERARNSRVHEETLLAGTIQGGIYTDLRKRSSRMMSSVSDYLPIGGVVPLLENYRYSDLVNVILASKLNASMSLPIHLFGGGHPMFIPMAVLLGVDLFDSSSYVKYARGGRLLYPDGTRDLDRIFEFPPWSPLCDKFTADELRAMEEGKKTYWLSMHNLVAISNEIRETRERIREGNLWQYAEWRSQAHPYLRDAFRALSGQAGKIEKFQEISKKGAMFFPDQVSMSSPYVRRLKKFTANYVARKYPVVCVSDSQMKKKSAMEITRAYESGRTTMLVPWNGIHAPIELEETFPVQQSISSRLFGMHRCRSQKIGSIRGNGQERDFDLEKVRAVADYQYGPGIGRILFPDGSEIRKSKKTGRIRTVSLGGKITATLRAMDGFLTLTIDGARLIDPYSRNLSITVTDDSAEFNAKGFNVFCKFVAKASPRIISGNDTLVHDRNGKLVAVGKAALPGFEMRQFDNGIAVNVHSGSEGHHGKDTDG